MLDQLKKEQLEDEEITWEESLIINLTDDGLTNEIAQEYVEFVKEFPMVDAYKSGARDAIEAVKLEKKDISWVSKHGKVEKTSPMGLGNFERQGYNQAFSEQSEKAKKFLDQ